jgi:hypothetical protein
MQLRFAHAPTIEQSMGVRVHFYAAVESPLLDGS